MIKSALGKVMWVGRTTVFVVGLAVILAMVVGVASAAFGANGNNFIIGNGINDTTKNIASLTSRLTMNGTASAPGLQVTQQSTGTTASGVGITVPTGKAPIKVNSGAGKATNLNADKLDGNEPGQLPGSIASTNTISGTPGLPLTLNTNTAFVGPTATVTTTSSQRLVGAVQVALGDGGGLVIYDVCYQPSGGGTITNFIQNAPSAEPAFNMVPLPAMASVVPGAGTWKVGFCARTAANTFTYNRTSNVNGWVQVVNQ